MKITPEMLLEFLATQDPKDLPGNVSILKSTRVRLTAMIIIFAFVFEAARTYGIEISADTQYTVYGSLGLLMGTDMARPVGHRVKPGQPVAASVDSTAAPVSSDAEAQQELNM